MNQVDKKIFIQAVYDVVCRIPIGRATSYGAIAKAIGYPNMSRLVGKVLNEESFSKNGAPAHRVVNSQGVLSGRIAFGASAEMQKLLEAEGITVINNKISNWKKVYWNPIEEITLE